MSAVSLIPERGCYEVHETDYVRLQITLFEIDPLPSRWVGIGEIAPMAWTALSAEGWR